MGRAKNPSEKARKVAESKKRWWEEAKKSGRANITRARIKKNHARPALGKTKDKSPGWKGGRYSTERDKYIYVYVEGHPNAVKGGKGHGNYVLEHRLVMEELIGRYLEKDEDVNHINGVKDDNRPENLMLVRHNAHYSICECPKCGFNWGTR